MSLRTFRERVYQTLAFEIGGLCIVAPLYARIFGATASETLTVILALSAAAILWSPLHNTVFDWADLRLTGRLASDRPQGLRLLHALSHEVTVMMLTLPLLVWLGGHSLFEALLVDLGFTLVYTAYAWFFHICYDCLRPMRAARRPAGADQMLLARQGRGPMGLRWRDQPA